MLRYIRNTALAICVSSTVTAVQATEISIQFEGQWLLQKSPYGSALDNPNVTAAPIDFTASARFDPAQYTYTPASYGSSYMTSDGRLIYEPPRPTASVSYSASTVTSSVMAYSVENPYAANGIDYASGVDQLIQVFNYYSWNSAPTPNQIFSFSTSASSPQYSDPAIMSWRDDRWYTSFTLESPLWRIAPENIGSMSDADVLNLMQSAFAAGEIFNAAFRSSRLNGEPSNQVLLSGLAHITSVTSVPEPTTVALLGLGLLGFAASRRKSANSKNA